MLVLRVFVKTFCVLNLFVWFVCGLSRDVVWFVFIVVRFQFSVFMCLCVYVCVRVLFVCMCVSSCLYVFVFCL